MKLHLPVLLRKALLACFSVVSVCTLYRGGIAAAADLTLGDDASLIIDYADTSRITDLDGGTLTLAGGTKLLLSNCGAGDGKTYTLLTGVSGLLDEEGNAILLDSTNNAVSFYFDATQPGTGFWAKATLVLTPDGFLQLVRHNETVKAAQDITTRQTSTLVYNYYEGISFKDIAYSPSSSAYGGAIYGGSNSTITLSGNGSVTFSGNTASFNDGDILGGAIYGNLNSTIELSGNGIVEFGGNEVFTSNDSTFDTSTFAYGGAIYYGNATINHNLFVKFSDNKILADRTVSAGYVSVNADGGSLYGCYSTIFDNDQILFSKNLIEARAECLATNPPDTYSYAYARAAGGAIYIPGGGYCFGVRHSHG